MDPLLRAAYAEAAEHLSQERLRAVVQKCLSPQELLATSDCKTGPMMCFHGKVVVPDSIRPKDLSGEWLLQVLPLREQLYYALEMRRNDEGWKCARKDKRRRPRQ